MNSNPNQSPTEHEPSQRDTRQLHAEQQPSGLDSIRLVDREPWYLRYPLSSFLALNLAATVTVVLWIALIVLADSSSGGELLPAILGWLTYVVIGVALFAIMWFFQTGAVSSIMIAFVMWCHLLFVGYGLLGGLMTLIVGAPAGPGYDFPDSTVFAIPWIALPIAILHGVVVGVFRKRPF